MNQEIHYLPYDPASEGAVLGAMMLDEGALYSCLNLVVETDFYKPLHRLVYKALSDLAFQGIVPDLVTVQGELHRTGKLEQAGGPMALVALTEAVGSISNIEAYCALVTEKSRLRRLWTATHTIRQMIEQNSATASVVIDEAENLIFDMGADRIGVLVEKVGTGWEEEHERLAKLAREGRMPGIPTGFEHFDAYTGGMHPGKLIVVAARPGVGKSALTLNMAVDMAKRGVPTSVFSLEMPKEELRARIVCSEARIDSMQLTTGIVSAQHLKDYATVMGLLKDVPLYLNDDSTMQLGRLVSGMRLLVRKYKVKVVVVDYLQLLTVAGHRGDRREEVSKISRVLKTEAKKLMVTVVALSQVNRDSEKGGKKGPISISQLRESGTIEQDADMIVLLDPDEDREEMIYVNIAKNRGGPTGKFWLEFEKRYLRFRTYHDKKPSQGDDRDDRS